MTTARDMYNSKVLEERTGSLGTAGEKVFYNSCVDMFLCKDSKNVKITKKIHVDIYIDDRRGVEVSSFWFEGKAFALCCVAGREYEDAEHVSITDSETYIDAAKYLLTLSSCEETSVYATDEDEDIEELDYFYSYKITASGATDIYGEDDENEE